MHTAPDQALTIACASAQAHGWAPEDLAVAISLVPDEASGQWRVKFTARDPAVVRAATVLVDDRTQQVNWLPA